MLCTCWCQGWAEIHIRRPTGNTSWMMRVQNQIGNNSAADLPIREISAMFLRNPDLEKESHQASTVPSGIHTPANPTSIPSSAAGSPTHQGHFSGKSCRQLLLMTKRFHVINWSFCTCTETSGIGTTSPVLSPSSPKSPGPSSPTGSGDLMLDASGKALVRRSNSSPEMSDSMKPIYISQQNLIQEQDEDELTLSTKSILDNVSSDTNLTFCDDKPIKLDEVPIPIRHVERPSTLTSSSSHLSKGGSTSPYRRSYEAIPEEVLSQKDTAHPLLSLSPSKRDKFQTQHSVDETVRSRVSVKEKETTDLPPIYRDRTFTISVMSPAVRNKGLRRILSAGSGDTPSSTLNKRDFESRSGSESSNIRSGMSPSFVFLQLCAQGFFGQGTKPLLVPPTMEKSLKVWANYNY